MLECFSSATRLDILRMLAEEPLNISELAERLCISSPVVTRHIARLENAGLVISRMLPGKRGIKKVCVLCEQQLVIDLTYEDSMTVADAPTSLALGSYTAAANVTAPCGLMVAGRTIGLRDDPRYFQSPEHQNADMLWFSSGSLQYPLPKKLSFTQQEVEISFWLCCKTFSQNDGFMTLTFSSGDSVICTVKEPVHTSADNCLDARFQVVNSPLDIQGEKRSLRITKAGTWYGQERVSDFSIKEFPSEYFSFTISGNSRSNVCYLFEHAGASFLIQNTSEAEYES